MSVYFLVHLLNLTAPVRDATLATSKNGGYVSEYRVQYDQGMESPAIEPNQKQYNLAKGASVTVQCISSSPISWYRAENLPWTSTELATCGTTGRSSSSGSYCVSMVFNAASVGQTGRYYCVKDNVLRRYRKQYGWKRNVTPHRYLTDLEAEFQATSMYLFVYDPERMGQNSKVNARYNIIRSGASLRLVCGVSNCRRGLSLPNIKLALSSSADVKENDILQSVIYSDPKSKKASCDMEVKQELIIDSAKEENSGSYRCEANWTNPDGSMLMTTFSEMELYVVDPAEGFVYFLEDTNDTVIRVPMMHQGRPGAAIKDQPMTIAIKYEYFRSNFSCSWYRDGKPIEALCGSAVNCSEQYEIRHKWTRDSLTILEPSIWDSGRYTVECDTGNGTKRNTSGDVFIEGDWEVKVSPDRPTVASNPMELMCRSRGTEDPEFQLYFITCQDQKWDECRASNDKKKLKMESNSKHNTPFEVNYVSVIPPEGFGIVICEVSSAQGTQSAEALLQDSSQVENVVECSLYGTVGRKYLIMGVLLAALLVLLFVCIVCGYRQCTEKKASLHSVGYARGNDRLHFLPEVYRFPREKLQLYEQLGRGEFGVIWKAKVSGVVEDPSLETVVVAKEAREQNDEQMMAMLLSELRALVHVGHHLNVVNLLGAVVDNFSQGELMLIIEYCQFGDLKDFLQQNREYFENNDYDGLFSGTVPPVGTIGYRFSKTDLLYWASQVACGMDYLGTSGLIHGDLAARNVLLSDGSIVKICDFGMSRETHPDDVVKKSISEWLPMAWMALESIRDGTFSTSTDVWAYGVLLWELYTLGADPYSTILKNETILDMLEQGYRMEKPEYASMEVYLLMRNCWESEPSARPTFKQLHTELHGSLPSRLSQHYGQLNDMYVFMNAVEKEPEPKKTTLHVYVNESTIRSIRMPEIASNVVAVNASDAQMQMPALPEQILEKGSPVLKD